MIVKNSLSFSWKAAGLEIPKSFVVVICQDGDSKDVPQLGTTHRGTQVAIVGATDKQKSQFRFAWNGWGLKLSFVDSIDEKTAALLERYEELSKIFASVHKETETDMNAYYAAKAADREFSYGGSGDYHRQYSGRD